MTVQESVSRAALSECALAQRCAAHDPAALRHLVSTNNQRLFRAAWSVLRDRHEAEEAVQAAYLKAVASIGAFEGRSSLSTWLTRIVVNEALGRLRSARRRHAALEGQGVVVLERYREALMRGSEPAAPDAAVAREQLRKMLEQAIAGLHGSFRSVFVLREIEGLSVEETAEALAIPAATVKTRLHRARTKLQRALDPEIRGALDGAFPFAGADCAAMTESVLRLILIRE
jgi:RNA polymerase sigma-70 factor (ECF subfamily)